MMASDKNSAFIVSSGDAHPDAADLSLYAMELVTGDQAAGIADHLSRCVDCREELARIRGDLALAAISVDFDMPSASARQRLLDHVAREKKTVPVSAKGPAQGDAIPQPGQRPAPTFARSGSVFLMEGRKPPRRTKLIVLTWVGWTAAAAICLVSGLLLRDRQNLRTDLAAQDNEIARLDADAASAHRLMDALTDPAAMHVSMRMPATPKPGIPYGSATYNPQKGTLIFLAGNVDPLEQYKTYELWIIPADNSAPIPAGTFHPDQQGNASVVMPDLPRGISAKAFGVTVEPEGGSQSPSMPLVMFGN